MDTQVSPAVVVIVLILIVAILVGLYFLVVESKPGIGEGEVEMAPTALVPGPAARGQTASVEADQEEEGTAGRAGEQVQSAPEEETTQEAESEASGEVEPPSERTD